MYPDFISAKLDDGVYVSTPFFESVILALCYFCGESRIPLCHFQLVLTV